MQFNEKLISILKTDTRFVGDEGELIKAAVIDHAWKIDHDLVKLLLSDTKIKETFFDEIEKHWIFNINKFIEYISEKNFLTNSYTRFKNKIGLNIDGKFLKERGEVSLVWPYKDCVLEGGQTKEEEKRKEIFFNQLLARDEIDRLLDPKVLTGWKRYTVEGVQKADGLLRNEEGTLLENIIIKGNNLIALHTLKKQFREKVKLIYIDPPYNTGGDANIFSYNNTFNHSSWLTFMKNRLETGKELLTQDGFIVIAIDHAELFYLGAIADEIFGIDNRIGIITVLHNPKGRNQAKFLSENSEYMLLYAKNREATEFNKVALDDKVIESFNLKDENGRYRYENFLRARTVWSRKKRPKNWYPIYVSKDLKDITTEYKANYYEIFPITDSGEFSWKNIKDSFNYLNVGDYFKAVKENNKIQILHKYYEQQVIKNVWIDKKYQSEFHGTNLLKKIIGETEFSYPKSIYTVLDIIKLTTKNDDIIVDFFAGSGTTAHATLELNQEDGGDRKYILVEQLDEHVEICVNRICNLIEHKNTENKSALFKQKFEDGFLYCELMKYNEAFIDNIQSSKTSEDLIKIWKNISQNSFLNWYVNPAIPQDAIEDFTLIGENENGFEKQKKLLMELLDKNQLYVNLSEIDDEQFNVSDEDKELNRQFYKDSYNG
ncbi:MAG: DNA methyltransferase [Calditrichaceae bacterium]